LKKNYIFSVLLLTIIWIILTENLSLTQAIVGLTVSTACVACFNKLFPIESITGIKIWRLFLYFFYLIGQIYMAGFAAMKLTIKGANVDIVKVKTNSDNDFFNVMLANSITLTPGTLSLELNEQEIHVLWLRGKDDDPADLENADELIKGKLEKQLQKAQL